MEKKLIEIGQIDKVRKALPKTKALANKNWSLRAGNGVEAGTVKTAACHTMGCSGHCQTNQASI